MKMATAFARVRTREWAAHSRIGRQVGMSDADVERIVAGPGSGGGDPIETALLRATD